MEAKPRHLLDRSVRVNSLLTGLFVLLASQQLLLWRFLDFAPWWLYALASLALVTAAAIIAGFAGLGAGATVSIGVIAPCTLISFVLCILGGEGGFFYQNEDWQVRNAQLFDIVGNPWPFVYTVRGIEEVQRAQIGMFLIPGLMGKAFGRPAADAALLVQNAGMITLTLSCASILFGSARSRLIAAAVFVLFSGMDIVGQEIKIWVNPSTPRMDHLERWANGPLYSSHIAQIFWAPHHSIVGWLGATLYLLWRSRHIRLGPVLAFVPLFPIWSPLAVMGLLPFLAHAGLTSLYRREVGWPDLLPTVLTGLISIPSLAYLGASSTELGHHFFLLRPLNYLAFEAVEVLPYIAAAFIVAMRSRFGGVTLLIVAASLLLLPNYQIGDNGDFQMRASIPALFILALITVDVLVLSFAAGASAFARVIGMGVVAVLAIGSITGWREVRRALVHQPSPRVACTLHDAWEQLEIVLPPGQIRLYVAPAAAFPVWMQPKATARVPNEPMRCWDRPWKLPRE